MDLGLAGRRCIVTGASRGIGAATAEAFAAEGAHVALVARSRDALVERARALEKSWGVRALAVAADLSTPGGVQGAIAEAIGGLDGVDVLVNNAGASPLGALDRLSDEAWQESIDLKLLGYVRAMRAVLPAMRAQRAGRIVNVLGIAGVAPEESYALACLNTALAHVTRSTAQLVAKDGITVLGIHPGPTATERLLGALEAGARAAGAEPAAFAESFARARVPLGRIARPEEIARMILVLASDASSFMTGSAVHVDGGIARNVL